MRKLFFLAVSFLVFCTPSLVSACTCVFTPGTCQQSWKSADLIFARKVTRKVPVGAGVDIDVSYTIYAFEFQVTEVFRGFAFERQTILVHTGAGGGDCGYQFKVGSSYLVYASLHDGRLGTNICTPTRPSAGALHTVDEKEADAAKWHGGTMGDTTETGEFELWLLRPSQYRLVFRRKIDGHVNFGVPPVKSEA